MSRILPIIITVLMFAIVGGGAFVTLEVLKPKPEQADEAIAGLSVFGERVMRDDLVFQVDVQGEVRPQREIAVAPQISGRISFVSPDFIDGGFIREGQTLIRLESADYELGVVRARSGVASAEQSLIREQAEAEIAIQDLEKLGITESSPLARREPQLAGARAQLASAEAQLADAELALSRTAVIAPFTGRVRMKSVDVGQFVSPGQSLGQIFATDIVEVVLPITGEELGRLALPIAFAETRSNPGPEVVFTGDVAGAKREWRGRITRTSAAVNSQTRLINVIAELRDPYGAGADQGVPMAPGLFVDASILGSKIDDLLVAPRGSIRSGNKIYIGDTSESQLRIYDVDLVYSDPEGAWFHSNVVEDGALAIVSPIQAAFDGMNITLLERMEDGTIYEHGSEAAKSGDATSGGVNASIVTGTEEQ
ncbi:MAG: efflux RND transporter periplasmic adaptor subunit [Pseudomonadota bacterium]